MKNNGNVKCDMDNGGISYHLWQITSDNRSFFTILLLHNFYTDSQMSYFFFPVFSQPLAHVVNLDNPTVEHWTANCTFVSIDQDDKSWQVSYICKIKWKNNSSLFLNHQDDLLSTVTKKIILSSKLQSIENDLCGMLHQNLILWIVKVSFPKHNFTDIYIYAVYLWHFDSISFFKLIVLYFFSIRHVFSKDFIHYRFKKYEQKRFFFNL